MKIDKYLDIQAVLLTEEMAEDKAAKMGLKYVGLGRWADDKGVIRFKTSRDRLIPHTPVHYNLLSKDEVRTKMNELGLLDPSIDWKKVKYANYSDGRLKIKFPKEESKKFDVEGLHPSHVVDFLTKKGAKEVDDFDSSEHDEDVDPKDHEEDRFHNLMWKHFADPMYHDTLEKLYGSMIAHDDNHIKILHKKHNAWSNQSETVIPKSEIESRYLKGKDVVRIMRDKFKAKIVPHEHYNKIAKIIKEHSTPEGALRHAVKHGDNEIFTTLHHSGMIDWKEVSKHPPIHHLVHNINDKNGETIKKMISQLVQSGHDVNHVAIDGSTPLSVAVSNGNHDMAKHLLKHGANPNSGRSLLTSALYNRDPEMFKHLLDHGADPKPAHDAITKEKSKFVRAGNKEFHEILQNYMPKQPEPITPQKAADNAKAKEIAAKKQEATPVQKPIAPKPVETPQPKPVAQAAPKEVAPQAPKPTVKPAAVKPVKPKLPPGKIPPPPSLGGGNISQGDVDTAKFHSLVKQHVGFEPHGGLTSFDDNHLYVFKDGKHSKIPKDAIVSAGMTGKDVSKRMREHFNTRLIPKAEFDMTVNANAKRANPQR